MSAWFYAGCWFEKPGNNVRLCCFIAIVSDSRRTLYMTVGNPLHAQARTKCIGQREVFDLAADPTWFHTDTRGYLLTPRTSDRSGNENRLRALWIKPRSRPQGIAVCCWGCTRVFSGFVCRGTPRGKHLHSTPTCWPPWTRNVADSSALPWPWGEDVHWAHSRVEHMRGGEGGRGKTTRSAKINQWHISVGVIVGFR